MLRTSYEKGWICHFRSAGCCLGQRDMRGCKPFSYYFLCMTVSCMISSFPWAMNSLQLALDTRAVICSSKT